MMGYLQSMWGGWSETRGRPGTLAPASRMHVQETSVFLTCDVFGGAYESQNIFLTDFSVSSFLQIMHLIHSVMDEKVLSV